MSTPRCSVEASAVQCVKRESYISCESSVSGKLVWKMLDFPYFPETEDSARGMVGKWDHDQWRCGWEEKGEQELTPRMPPYQGRLSGSLKVALHGKILPTKVAFPVVSRSACTEKFSSMYRSEPSLVPCEKLKVSCETKEFYQGHACWHNV